jgi:hypothetical protein
MQIIAHRGFWEKSRDQNTIQSFRTAIDYGFGIETDLRDQNNEIVVSHDIPKGETLTFDEFLYEYQSRAKKILNSPYLALNIKSDGLQQKIQYLINQYKISNYFVFDMSIPDTLGYLKADVQTFIRKSEYELELSLYSQVSGIWLDQFEEDWVTGKIIKKLIADHKQVCIVSPELHGRKYEEFWNRIRDNLSENNNIMICTDFPIEANKFFNG